MEARQDIEAGEELTYDYATSDIIGILLCLAAENIVVLFPRVFPVLTFDVVETDHPWHCDCGSPICRRQILPTDWRLPELRERYGVEHFLSYIQDMINAEKDELSDTQKMLSLCGPTAATSHNLHVINMNEEGISPSSA